MPVLSYRDVLDRYDRARAFGEQRDLPTYAADLNDMYDTQDFSAGLQDGWWKRASTRADQNFFEPIGHATTEPLLGAVGGMFGAEDTGRKVGLGLPRTLADTLPLFIPGVDAAYGGALAAGATGGLMAAHTYADTGSARDAAISGVTGAAMPYLAHMGGALGLRLAGAPLARGLLTDTGEAAGLGKAGDFFSQRLATTAPEFLSQYAGSQTALAAGQLASAKYENSDEDVFSKDFATQFLLGQIPFTALDVVHGAKALATKTHIAEDGTVTKINGLPTREQVASFTTPDVAKPLVESKPLEPRQGSPEEYAKLDEIAAAYDKINNDPLATQAMKSGALANLIKAVQNPKAVPTTLSEPMVTVRGWTDGRGRILVDHYSDTAGGEGEQVPAHGTMVYYEPKVQNLHVLDDQGNVEFQIPLKNINPADKPLAKPFVDPNQGELPAQPKPGGLRDTAGWKLHLAVTPENQEQVSSILKTLALRHKVGRSGEQEGKDITVYVGDHQKAIQAANVINEKVGHLLAEPVGDTLKDDKSFGGKVMGRFDAAGDPEFHQYGHAGVPYLMEDVQEQTFGGNKDFTGAKNRADKRLREKYGKFYSTTDNKVGPIIQGAQTAEAVYGGQSNVHDAFRDIRKGQPFTPEEKQTAIQMGAKPEAVLRLSERIPKSADPILNSIRGGINLDAQGRVVRMGNTDVGLEGEMNERRFLKRTQMPAPFLAAAKEMYPEAFGKEGVVNVNALVKGLQERPMVQVRRLDVTDKPTGENVQRQAAIEHELDTLDPEWRQRGGGFNPNLTPERQAHYRDLLEERQSLLQGNRFNEAESATARFSSVNPYPPEVLRGEKEVAPGHRITWAGDITGNLPIGKTKQIQSGGTRMTAPEEFDGPHFTSQHYPSDAGKNQLFFVRGALHSFEPGARLPNGKVAQGGEKIFEVWEGPQLDIKTEKNRDGTFSVNQPVNGQTSPKYKTRVEAQDWLAAQHPMLDERLREQLGLETAVQQARALGADAIALSDGESAMMTEKHDKAALPWTVRQVDDPSNTLQANDEEGARARMKILEEAKPGKKFVIEKTQAPSQAPGMTAAYDIRGPRTLEKITGAKPEKVDFGVHQGATKPPSERIDDWRSGSPVFRNPDGTPKTSNTARLFSLDKISGGLAEDPTASIKEAVHRYEMAKQREVEARAKVAKAPQTTEEWTEDVKPEEVKKLVDEGLSPTQALGQAKLVHAASEVDEAMTDQAIAKEVVKQKAGDQYIGKEQNQYAKEAVKDENGKRLNFKNESEALQHRETVATSEGRDPEDWTVRNNGRGEYYLVEKLNRKVSLDIEDSGGHERVASQAEQDTEEQARDVREETAPEVDEDTQLETLQDQLNRFLALRPEDLSADLQPFLQPAKDFVEKKGKGEEVSAEEAEAFKKVTRRYLGWRNYSLDSQLPHDEGLVQEMGLREKGPVAWLDWYVKNAPNPADIQIVLIRELADAVRNSANALKITRDYEDGWVYAPAKGGAPAELNIPMLPVDREHALVQAPNLAHELAHHLTSELESRGDPAAKAFHKVLLDMQKVLEKSPLLPKKVQMAIAAAKEQGLYEKFRSYNVDLVDWFNNFVGKKNKQWLPVFYGLLHPQEMIAQTFGSRDFVGLLAGTKRTAPSGVRERVLDWFSRAWHTLAGLKAGTENMLGQLLEHFDDYLGKGSGYTGMDFIRDRLVAQGVRPEGLVSRVQTIRDLLKTGDPATSSKGWDRENGAGTLPVTAEYTPNLLDLSRTPGQLTKDILGMDPAFVAGHGDRIVRMGQDVHLAQMTAKKIQSGEIPDRVEEGVSGKLAAAAAQVNAMRKAVARYGREQQRFEATRNLDGHSFRNSIEGRMRNAVQPDPADPPANMDLARGLLGLATPMVPVETAADVRARTADEMLKRTKLQQATRAVEFNVLLQPHLSRIHPAHAARNEVLQREESNAHDRNSMLQLAYNWSDKVKGIDHKVLDNNVRVKNTEHLQNTASAIRLVANEIVKRGEVANWDHPEIQAVAKHLGPENREAVKTEYESAKRRYDMSNNGTWPRFYDDVIPLELAQTIAARDQVLPDSARQVAGDFYQTLKELKDPQAAPLAVEKLRALMTKLSPDTVLKVIAQGNAAMQSAEDHIAFLKSRSHYTSEQRYGKYHVTMLSADGKPIRLDGNTLQEVAAKRDVKEKQGARLLGTFPKEDANVATGTSQEVLNKLEELEGQRQQRQAAALDGLDPLTKQQLLDPASLTQELRTSLAAMQPLPGVARKFREGRESLNMLENDDQFYLRQNNYMRHKLTRAGDQLERLHPEIAGNLELKKYGDQMLEAFLTPDNPLARRLTSLVFFNKLAFEFGNTVLESMQHMTTGMQQLISETGTVGDAFALTQNASKAFWKHAFTGKWANEDQEWLVKQMKATGHDIQSSWNDIHDPNVIALRTANSGKSMAGRAMGAVDNLSKSFSQKAQGYGNYIGMLSAFEHGRAQGMSRDEAFQYAASSKNQGMYTGGKGQRPGLWRIKTKAIPQIMSSLQTYTLGWFGQMYTDYVRGFSKNRPQGLTRTQIEGSKKAFLYGLAVQATLAGALGLPGVGQGLALMQQATGVDMKGWVRAHMQDMFDEDQAGGGGITALAMNGLLAGVTPFDPSGRASIGVPFTGVDSYQGFSVANLAGAPGATLQDYVKGLTAVASGDRTGWEKLLPNFLKRPARLAMDDGDVRDARGGLLYQMSPQERALTLMGLPPSRIQRARDVAEAAKNAGKAALAKQKGLADNLAKMFDTPGGPQAVQQKLVELGQEQPELDLRQLVKQIGERRQRQQTPFDWRREVNPASELQGLNVYNPSTVAQGRAIQQQTESALGLRTPPNPRADMEAMTIDALLNSGAAKTEAEARKMLARKRPERPLQFPGSM